VNRRGAGRTLSWLNRVFWRWCELVGQCLDYGYPDALTPDDHGDGQLPDPGREYVVAGLGELERYLELRSRRPWH
jgi:hypothetical protein